jgi:hypothetical protein
MVLYNFVKIFVVKRIKLLHKSIEIITRKQNYKYLNYTKFSTLNDIH